VARDEISVCAARLEEERERVNEKPHGHGGRQAAAAFLGEERVKILNG
jgi:hypothetical protein